MANLKLRRALQPAIDASFPDDDLRQKRALNMALQDDATITPAAARNVIPQQVVWWDLAGTIVVGTNVGREIRLPQQSRLLRVDVALKTAPAAGNLVLRLTQNGQPVDSVTVQKGALAGATGLNAIVDAGTTMRIDVTTAGGANATVTLTYTVTG